MNIQNFKGSETVKAALENGITGGFLSHTLAPNAVLSVKSRLIEEVE